MDTLSADLLPSILPHSTVLDTLNMKEVAKSTGNDALLRECDNRLCVKRYLSQFVEEPIKLLDAMSKSNTVLSGSTSANFFVPGSSGPDSDLDFYVSRRATEIATFVKLGREAGIKWYNPTDRLTKMLEKGHGRMFLSASEWDPVEEKVRLNEIEEVNVRVVIQREPGMGRVCVELEDGTLKVTSSREYTSYPLLRRIIYGQVTHRGMARDVQLMVSHEETLLCKFIFDYHISCTQSYISGHTASHLYGRTSSRKEMYRWTTSSSPRRESDSVERYEGRGYRQVEVPLQGKSYALRSSDDEECITLPSYNFSGAPEEVVKGYEKFAGSLLWVQTERQVEAFTVPLVSVVTGNPSHGEWLAASLERYRVGQHDMDAILELMDNRYSDSDESDQDIDEYN